MDTHLEIIVFLFLQAHCNGIAVVNNNFLKICNRFTGAKFTSGDCIVNPVAKDKYFTSVSCVLNLPLVSQTLPQYL